MRRAASLDERSTGLYLDIRAYNCRVIVRLSVARLALFAACAFTLVACQTDGTGPIAAGPMTSTRAARECWMRTEKTSARENLDKRAEIVNKCIDEKMKAAGMK